MDAKDVQQRVIAIITASLAGDTSTRDSLANEILRDDYLLSASFAWTVRLAEDAIKIMAGDRGKSPEEMLRIIALIVAGHDEDEEL